MRERGIIFSAPMVRAILDGSKTQTRRILKPAPSVDGNVRMGSSPKGGAGWWDCHTLFGDFHPFRFQVGDRLWVRERWDACVKIVQKLSEYYNPPVKRFAATDPVPREFLEVDADAYPICPECGGDNVGIIAAPNDIPRWLCECGWRGES